ncbi:tRNA (adenine(22)-N(1))-methyltransferase TrmK [Bacillus sp. 03113]|uniref:tRNA (adenine(22)-N(1))-methyltransferase n=1 Tax=Bacillus sp. 03113 TaxID=2578211 RepID=UPI0011417276|nr:tRNA (adenine(22)-N(1))-methyltransferase TrmK [Bacillus sp. 03113]
MNIENLSIRLETVAKYIPNGCSIADIGSDHAYLPCHVVIKGIVPFAIAGEVVEGPYQSAKNQVEKEGLVDKISVRKGDGLDVLKAGEVECITIAGMGGALIASILEKGSEKLSSIKRLILQPNIGAIAIRVWLLENGWELIDEEILEEDGKIYEILIAEKGDPKKPYHEDMDRNLLLGPFLSKNPTEIFKKKWFAEKSNWERIIFQLNQASSTLENQMKKQELENKIQMVERILNDEKC